MRDEGEGGASGVCHGNVKVASGRASPDDALFCHGNRKWTSRWYVPAMGDVRTRSKQRLVSRTPARPAPRDA